METIYGICSHFTCAFSSVKEKKKQQKMYNPPPQKKSVTNVAFSSRVFHPWSISIFMFVDNRLFVSQQPQPPRH